MKTTESKELEKPISDEELTEAIKELKSGKSPGPDGYTAQYYKTFAHLLKTPLLSAFNLLCKPQEISNSFTLAHITVLPKPNKGTTDCTSYRPISLLNLDLKLLAKILANCLRPFLSKVIWPRTGRLYARPRGKG